MATTNTLLTYGDKSKKESFRKGKPPRAVVFPKWWKSVYGKEKKKK